MSESADGIGGSEFALDTRHNFASPSLKSLQDQTLNQRPSAAKVSGESKNQRLSFPSAKLPPRREAVSDAANSKTRRLDKQESAAQVRERRRMEMRERKRAEIAQRRANELAIEADENFEVDWRKGLKVLTTAWGVGLVVNVLILVCLWCYVSSRETDSKPLALEFSEIEVRVDEHTEVNFSLPTEITPDEEVDFDETIVQELTVEAEVDWSEESELNLDPMSDAGLFDNVGFGRPAVPGSSGAQSKGKTKKTAFFGLESSGDRLVFVVDCSGSMSVEGRFERAVYELGQSLRLMNDDQDFLVVLYNDRIYPMLDTPLKETRALKATDENVRRVMKWINFQIPLGSTFPSRAIQGSLEVQPSSIFFLSDGELADDTLGMLRRLNVSNSATGARKVPIHTITLGSTGAGAGIMELIADENDGRFVWAK